MMCSRGDFNFFLGLPVGKPDAAVYLKDVAGGVNGLENLHSQVGDVLAQLVGSVDLALDVPEVADGVQSPARTGMDTSALELKSGNCSPSSAASFCFISVTRELMFAGEATWPSMRA